VGIRDEKWSSKLGFILAAIGAAAGIGNVWRFSSLVGQNGGGAYLIPFLLAVFCCGVPLMILELAIGRQMQANVVAAFSGVSRRLAGVGWITWALVLLILSYYLVIVGWTLAYAVSSVLSTVDSFETFTKSHASVYYFLICTGITGVIVSKGVRGGIERLSTVLMPLCVLILIVMAIFATTLEGFGTGVSYFLRPDFSVLGRPAIWSAAFGQAFFSLSVGYGALLTYGSYLDESTKIPSSALIISVTDVVVAMIAGIVIFPIVFTFGLQPTLGAELAFSTLPKAFEVMPAGPLFAFAFFLLLFFAGLTSAVSMLEVTVAPLISGKKRSRGRIALLLTILVCIIGLPAALSYSGTGMRLWGSKVLDLMDDTIGTLGLPITALFMSIVFTWKMDNRQVKNAIGGSPAVAQTVFVLAKYFIPSVLIIVTVARLVTQFDFPGWHWLPDVPYIGQFGQGVAVLSLVLVVLITFLRRSKRKRK